MNLKDARIGYAGYGRDFSGPGDRRRFGAYATHRGLHFERADLSRDYDLVLVTHNGDVTGWTERKRREGDRLKLVFELVDAYFEQREPWRRLLKGAARYWLGTDSRLSSDFLKTLVHASEAADAVICSTPEQKAMVERFNRKVVMSFDYFGDDLGPPKEEYARGDKLRVVWEGQSTTLRFLEMLREPLNALRDHVELHVVSDPFVHRFFGRFGRHPSQDLLKGFECDLVFHPWERGSFSRHITAADVAVIPIDTRHPLANGKPENKLVLLWQLGMPVLASPTPAYIRTMGEAGVDMLCATPVEWRARLEKLIEAGPAELESIGRRCRDFADRAYSLDEFDARFDRAFELAGFSVSSRR